MSAHEKLKKSVVELIGDFQKNPFDYLYERDIQAGLFSRAYSNFESERIHMVGGYHTAESYTENKAVRTIPVKCEYPNSQRFDIAVIDANLVESYEADKWQERGWRNDRFWEQPICAAVELKYMQLSDRPRHRVSGFLKDIEKLKNYGNQTGQFLGLSMLFVQSDPQYSEEYCSGMRKLNSTGEVGTGIFAAIIGPSNVSWYERTSLGNSRLI